MWQMANTEVVKYCTGHKCFVVEYIASTFPLDYYAANICVLSMVHVGLVALMVHEWRRLIVEEATTYDVLTEMKEYSYLNFENPVLRTNENEKEKIWRNTIKRYWECS